MLVMNMLNIITINFDTIDTQGTDRANKSRTKHSHMP